MLTGQSGSSTCGEPFSSCFSELKDEYGSGGILHGQRASLSTAEDPPRAVDLLACLQREATGSGLENEHAVRAWLDMARGANRT
jgi:hypothetical protein